MAWVEIDSADTSAAETDIQFFYQIWVTATAYAVNAVRVPTTGNGYRYTVQSVSGSGTSGATEPTWPLKVGTTVVDNAGANQITWICTGNDDSMVWRVIRNCDNLPSQHPHYTSIPQYINEGKNELIRIGLPYGRKFLDLMPRLHNWRWYDATINAQAYLALPSSMLVLESMGYTKVTTAFSTATSTTYPSYEENSAAIWGMFDRAARGWPTRWRRAGSRIEMYPPPSSTPVDYRTNIVVMGIRREDDLTASSDILRMEPDLQNLVVELGTAITMERMGWESAAGRRDKVVTKLAEMCNISAMENNKNIVNTRTAGVPR